LKKFFKRNHKKIGLPPGTLLNKNEIDNNHLEIKIMKYNEDYYVEEDVSSASLFKDKLKGNEKNVRWVNVSGADTKIIQNIGRDYNIHPLVLEDIMNIGLRPKYDLYDNYIFITLNMLSYNALNKEIDSEQLSLLFMREINTVFSFQERAGDVFDIIRKRIRNNRGLIRKNQADYLIYTLIDTIVDNYFLVLEKTGEKIEDIEEKIINNIEEVGLDKIQFLKKELMFLRKSVWPLREIISALIRNESSFFDKSTIYYLRDIYDHLIEVIDIIESLREMLTGLLDIYLSSTSNKMNEVMKVLTIISTIFIPMTFIAGIYGMNFHYMPELKVSWAYPAVLIVMLTIAVGMLIYFKKKKWF